MYYLGEFFSNFLCIVSPYCSLSSVVILLPLSAMQIPGLKVTFLSIWMYDLLLNLGIYCWYWKFCCPSTCYLFSRVTFKTFSGCLQFHCDAAGHWLKTTSSRWCWVCVFHLEKHGFNLRTLFVISLQFLSFLFLFSSQTLNSYVHIITNTSCISLLFISWSF